MTPAVAPVGLINVSKTFGEGAAKCTAVHQASFCAEPGELVLLLGPSGSGKTTLLSLMAGLIQPSAGSVRLFGKEIGAYNTAQLQQDRANHLGFVFQTFLLIDALNVLENVSLVMRFAGKTRRQAHDRCRELLAWLGISHLERKFPSEISHGERQRVAIARAMANRPEVIFADEPTASLDSLHGIDIIRLLKGYACERGACVIVASHDLRIIDAADRVLQLEDGCLREDSPIERSAFRTEEVTTNRR